MGDTEIHILRKGKVYTRYFDKNEYESHLYNKLKQNLQYSKKLIKITETDSHLFIPSFNQASNLYKYNYNFQYN